MIPHEAVEAAAEAAYAQRPATYYLDDSLVSWEQLDESGTGRLRKMRQIGEAWAALEAAAPHMLAEAWDEGYTTGNAHNGRRDANPYRGDA